MDGGGHQVPSPVAIPVTLQGAEELVAISATTQKNTDACFYHSSEDNESILPNGSLSNGEIMNDDDYYEEKCDEDSDGK